MDGPVVSIITPTYRHASILTKCIESVLAQSYANWEQVIVDDGSGDGSILHTNAAAWVTETQDAGHSRVGMLPLPHGYGMGIPSGPIGACEKSPESSKVRVHMGFEASVKRYMCTIWRRTDRISHVP